MSESTIAKWQVSTYMQSSHVCGSDLEGLSDLELCLSHRCGDMPTPSEV
jgi:hypothetical protein